ncbi:MAG: hypothetical protein QNK05_04140 [Myxococcota bacterium]|nr:hypothetical protein [Myxococcota bacterium]
MERSPTSRQRLRRGLLVAIAVLYAVSIPWYREGGAAPEHWLGLPDWAAVAVVCYVGVAILNAAAWLLTDVDDDAPDDSGGGG